MVLAPLILGSRAAIAQPDVVAVVAWLGLVATALAYALYSKGLQRTSAITAGTLSLAEPLAAAVLSTTFLGEDLSGWERTGCTVILTGLLITVAGHRPSASAGVTDEVPVVAVGCVRMPVGTRAAHSTERAGRSAGTPG